MAFSSFPPPEERKESIRRETPCLEEKSSLRRRKRGPRDTVKSGFPCSGNIHLRHTERGEPGAAASEADFPEAHTLHIVKFSVVNLEVLKNRVFRISSISYLRKSASVEREIHFLTEREMCVSLFLLRPCRGKGESLRERRERERGRERERDIPGKKVRTHTQ